MSSTHSELRATAPTLLADGLIEEASKLQSGRRMFMTAYLGVALDRVLEELLRRADGNASIKSERGPVELRTVRAGERSLIPYLVGAAPAAGPNLGSEGFAARLRSEFSDGDDGRVLLLLGDDLVETIVTAAIDAALLPALGWERLCTAATAAANPALRGVVEKVAEQVGRRALPSAAALERLARFAGAAWDSASDAGDHLYDAGPFLRDPNVEQSPRQRLKDAADLRAKIEEWSAPGQDLEARLLKRLGGRHEAVQKVARAVVPAGINWSRFTLDDLMSGAAPARFAFRRPLDVSGGAAHVVSGSTAALWLDSPGREIEIALAAPAPEAAAVQLMGPRGLISASGIDRGSRYAQLELRSVPDGWTFATLALVVEGDGIDRVRVAVCVRTGSWFPIERSLALDVAEQAFIVEEDDPLVLAVAPGGGILGPIPVRDELPTGVTVDLRVSRERQEQTIPVLLLGGDVEEEPPDDEDGAARPPASSPLHALLRAAADSPDRTADELAVSFRVAEGEPYLTVAGELEHVQAQDVAGIDGFALEREILARARTWAFVATRGQDSLAVHADAELERLSLGTLPAQQVEGFQQARERFFAATASYGSVYALGAGEARGEALAYVQAYTDLLATLPESGRYEPEYDRVLLVDQVAVGEGSERYFAPTNPVTVAFYLAFADAVEQWLPRAIELDPADLDSVSPYYLLPLVHAGGEWYEAAPGNAFLWRRYQALATNPVDLKQDARFIFDRLQFFLDVFPAYAPTPAGGSNPHALSVSFVGDDDGQALVAGLERFYRKDLRGEMYEAPRLEIALVNDGAQVPAAVRRLIAGEGADGEGSARRAEDLRRLVRSRVTFSARRELSAFSHLTFALRTPAEESPAQVDMSERASTAFVGGLATIPGRAASLGANLRTFSWGTFTQPSERPPAGSPPEAMLAFVSRRCLELVGGQPRGLLRSGVTTMRTTAVEPDFMPEAYASSVWVVHLDRLLGLEAFASSGDVAERYLVEYGESPELGGAGLEGVTATKRVDPYHNALTQALSDLGTLRGAGLQRILRLLNSVHGRWALQLLRQSTEKVRERIGTVAAIAVLEELDRAFHGPDGSGVLIPLDELFEQVPGARPPGRDSSVTDDLLFVHVAGGEIPHLSARLIEVKYRTTGRPPLGGARQQIENTQEHLERLLTGDGPGRLFRARDVAQLIRNSRARALAFGLIAAEDDPDLEHALERVAEGRYTLSFEYSVGTERLIGDVISVEYETDVAAIRSTLPGAGRPAGLIRVGRPALQALAAGRPLPTGRTAWDRPDFRGGGAADDGRPAHPVPQPPAPPADDAAPREEDTGAPSDGADVRAEVEALARALDAAALKYELELEPFRPDLAQVGPSVIRFRARPLGRQSLRGVAGHAADLAREIGATGEVLVAQEPYYITVDVPRRERQVVEYSAHIGSLQPTAPGSLDFLVGVAPSGEVVAADLARLPHLLIAGATDSGKSVFLRSLLCSLLEYRSPSQLSILLVDPKQVDFIPFEDLPHLVRGRIVTDPAEAVTMLSETIGSELDRRRPVLKQAGVTSALEFYDAGGTLEELPQMVVIVDEFADLAATLDRAERTEFMTVIQRYGQLTRAFGIYLVLATQRPSVQVITGEIKANLTARVAMKLQSSADSVTILGHKGAESLSARGDLLFEHGGAQQRLQGFLVRPSDVARVVRRWTSQSGTG